MITTDRDSDPTLPHLGPDPLGPLGRPEIGPRSASEYLWDKYDARIDDSVKSVNLWDMPGVKLDENGDVEVGTTAAMRGERRCSTLARKGKCKLGLFAFLLAVLFLALVLGILLPGGGNEPSSSVSAIEPGDATSSEEILMLPTEDNGLSEARPGSGSGGAEPTTKILMPPIGGDELSSAQLGSGSVDGKPKTAIPPSNIGEEDEGQKKAEVAFQGAITSTAKVSSKDSEDNFEDEEPKEAPGSNPSNGVGGQSLVSGGHVQSGALHNYDGSAVIDLQAQWQARSIPSVRLGSGSGDVKPSTEIVVSNNVVEEGHQEIAEDASQGAIARTSENASEDSSGDSSGDTFEDVEPDEMPGSNHDTNGGGQPLVHGDHTPSKAIHNYKGSDVIDLQAQWRMRSIPSVGLGSTSGDAEPSTKIAVSNVGDVDGRQEITESVSHGAIATSEDTSEDTFEDIEPKEIPRSKHSTGRGGQPIIPGGNVPITGRDEEDLQSLWDMRIIP